MSTSFDIIICGGGHVGSCLALALAQQNISVAIVDSLSPEKRKNDQDNRVFALSNDTKKIVENLDVWPSLQSHITPIEHIHVSNKGSFGAARLHAKDFKQDALAYMIASRDLQIALNQAIEKTKIKVFSPATIQQFSMHDDHVSVTMSDNKTFTAQWLIGADGVHSFIRQQANIGITKKDYQQKAIVTIIDLDISHHFTAYERFVDKTAIALLPHTPWQSVLIWSGDNDAMDQLMALEDKLFLSELQQAFAYRLGKFSHLSPRFSYSLSRTEADRVHLDRLLLIGNAAQTLHPIGAQGFNLALRNVALLSFLLKEAKRNYQEMFVASVLDEYVRRQEIDTSKTFRFTEHLVNMSSSSGLLNHLGRTVLINTLGAFSLAQDYLLNKD